MILRAAAGFSALAMTHLVSDLTEMATLLARCVIVAVTGLQRRVVLTQPRNVADLGSVIFHQLPSDFSAPAKPAGAVAGLVELLVASRPAFTALRYVGAGYLVYLGLRLLIAGRPVRSEPAAAPAGGQSGAPRHSGVARRAFAQGALCELSNPKTLLVFTSVIPQFVPGDGSGLDLTTFGCLFALLGLVSLVVYATVLGSARRVVGDSALSRGLVRAGGAVLVGFGVDLAIDPTS